jgi:hypothetical protein
MRKPLLADIRQYIEWMIDRRSLIRVTQNTERPGKGKTTTLRYGAPSPLVHDQYVRLLFRGQLNGFPFTGIQGGQQFGVAHDNQVAERRGIRDGQHSQSAMQLAQQVRLGLQFFH